MEELSSESDSLNQGMLQLVSRSKGYTTACSSSSRRFTEEQIKSLESIFSLETKLEPRKKLRVARDLGLEPRQIEREFIALKAKHEGLRLKIDGLKREKLSLELQLKELSGALEADKGGVGSVSRDVRGKDSNEDDRKSIYNYVEEENEVAKCGEDISLLTSRETWCNDNLMDKSLWGSNWWDSFT